MSESQWMTTVMSKMMGQINLVRIGQEYIADKGSFTLISGILNVKLSLSPLLMQQQAELSIPLLSVLLTKCHAVHASTL